MKINSIKFGAIVLCLLCLTFSAPAQKRKTTTSKAKRTVAEATTAVSSTEMKSGAEKVSTQIKNVSKFIYNLGGIARVIEDLDKEIAARKASRNAPNLNAKIKQDVISSIKNLRAGLVALEIEFRTKPALKPYLFQIQGISDMSGRAEDQANDGQFTESGKTLLMVVEKLSDTLAALP
jgi:hypothetical protein